MLSFLFLFPLINLISCGFFGFLLGHRGASDMTKICLSFLILTLISFWLFWLGAQTLVAVDAAIAPWINIAPMSIDWVFLCDSVTIVMLTIVIIVSFVVHFYSLQYMGSDPHLCRFMSFLSLFTLFMLILVTSANFLQLFLGWEGVGICSFLLITFWYTRAQANKAALKAMIVNRVGDVGILLGVIAVYSIFTSTDYSVVFPLTPYYGSTTFTVFGVTLSSYMFITLFFLVGVAGKSAQFGLHTWLPDAMEGPSPVSALIHAATMVTAGIFLVVRSSILFEYTPASLFYIVILGSVTALFGGSCATAQYDIKKVVAYSTCSQLGYMLLCCGFSEYSTSLYHLVNHAFFKALLFLTAGNIIHSLAGEQDIRRMGGLTRLVPATYSLFLLGSLSLMGLPYLSGFFSKDFIIEVVAGSYTLIGGFAQLVVIFVTSLTAFYSTRLLILVFFQAPRGFTQVYKSAHEATTEMLLPLVLLATGAIFSGYLWEELFIGYGTDFHANAIFTQPLHTGILYPEFITFFIKNIPLVSVLAGTTLSFIFLQPSVQSKFKLTYTTQKILFFFNNKWYIDKIYNRIFVVNLLQMAYNNCVRLLDRGFFEWVGPTGLYSLLRAANQKLLLAQTGHIVHYVAAMAAGWVLLVFLMFF